MLDHSTDIQRTRPVKHLCILLSLLLLVSFASADEPVRERIEWIDIWVTDADKSDLPRALLVCDSITRGLLQRCGKASRWDTRYRSIPSRQGRIVTAWGYPHERAQHVFSWL